MNKAILPIFTRFLTAAIAAPFLWSLLLLLSGLGKTGLSVFFLLDPLLLPLSLILWCAGGYIYYRNISLLNTLPGSSHTDKAERVNRLMGRITPLFLYLQFFTLLIISQAALIRLNISIPFRGLLGLTSAISVFSLALSPASVWNTVALERLTAKKTEIWDRRPPVSIAVKTGAMLFLAVFGIIGILITTGLGTVIQFLMNENGTDGIISRLFIRWGISILAALVLIGINFRLLVANLHKPLISFTQMLTNGLSGKLNQLVIRETWDETGWMIQTFTKFSNILKGTILRLQANIANLTSAETQLNASIENVAGSIEEISSNVTDTENQIEEQSANVNETSAAVEEIAKTIDSLDGMIKTQSSHLVESSSAVEEMITNSSSILKITERSADNVTELQKASSSSNEDIHLLLSLIDEVSEQSHQLKEANTLISGIASQTNLLAMNAAIEAAHAGDAGLGFAVVADEIRKLAENATIQSKNISNNLKRVVNSISQAVERSRHAQTNFGQVLEIIEQISSVTSEISQGMKEQESGGGQVRSALHSLNEITTSVTSGSSEMSSGNKEILKAINTLTQISDTVMSAIGTISTEAEEIKNATAKIVHLSKGNEQSLGMIGKDLDFFEI